MDFRSRFAAPEIREALLAFGFFLAVAFIFTAPLSLSPASQAANEGDPLHISWILAWVVHQLTTNPFQLFESNAFYPYPTSLAFSEHLTVEALMVGPIYLLSGNALLAQNIAVLVLCQNSALLKDHGCNLMHCKVLVSFCQHLMVEAPMRSV